MRGCRNISMMRASRMKRYIKERNRIKFQIYFNELTRNVVGWFS